MKDKCITKTKNITNLFIQNNTAKNNQCFYIKYPPTNMILIYILINHTNNSLLQSSNLVKKNGVGRSFENRSFENSQWLPHRRCQVMKKQIDGYTPSSQVRSGQVSNKKFNYLTPFLFMTAFQNTEKSQQKSGYPEGAR